MGYQTVKQVPTFRDYQHAHQWWGMTKPIRGRSVDLRPLAERRHADTYSIRKNPSNDAIECVLYNTPVVMFMPDGEVHICNSGWATASTHMFIEEVLGTGVSARARRGRSILKFDNTVLTFGGNEVLRLRKNGSKYEAINAQTHYAYKLNRKATNIVRGRYKDFYAYFKGFLKLRAHETQGKFYGPMQMTVECSFTELADALGTKDYYDSSYFTIDTDAWVALTKKPGTYTGYRGRAIGVNYEETMQKFLELIKSDQPEETKHLNFHKAALVLLTYNRSNIVDKKLNSDARTVLLASKTAKGTLDTTLFKWFANEVLERYEVPKGKVPSENYVGWIEEEK